MESKNKIVEKDLSGMFEFDQMKEVQRVNEEVERVRRQGEILLKEK